MTNGNSSDRLDRIEAIVESNSRAIQSMVEQRSTDNARWEETKQIVESNSRAIQAMMEQRATDRLEREEEKAEHQQRMARLEEIQADVARAQLGLTRLLAGLDEDRPTVLRKLSAIENKVDRLLDRTSE